MNFFYRFGTTEIEKRKKREREKWVEGTVCYNDMEFIFYEDAIKPISHEQATAATKINNNYSYS